MRPLATLALSAILVFGGGMAVATPQDSIARAFDICVDHGADLFFDDERLIGAGWTLSDSNGEVKLYFADKRKSFLMVSRHKSSFDCTMGINGSAAEDVRDMAVELLRQHVGERFMPVDNAMVSKRSNVEFSWMGVTPAKRAVTVAVRNHINVRGYFRGAAINVESLGTELTFGKRRSQ